MILDGLAYDVSLNRYFLFLRFYLVIQYYAELLNAYHDLFLVAHDKVLVL